LRSPRDVEGYRRFLAYSQALLEEGYVKLGHVPFPDFRSMIRVAPQLIALESYRSVYGKVAQFIADEQLRQAFSFHSLLVGGNPFATSAIYALIHALERKWGVWFPRGGTGALINQGLVKLFTDLGGEIRMNAPVARIETRDGRVTGVVTADGQRTPADIVASNADVVHTYADLLKDEPRARPTARGLIAKRFSMSLFVIYFGLKRQHPDLKHHMVLFGPRADQRDLQGTSAARGLLALLACAVRDGPISRAARLQQLLCSVAGPASWSRRHRLEHRGTALS
jgi:phytoene desaturase